METKYNPKDIEDKIYKKWLDGKFFSPVVDKNKKPYTIIMPPPNLTSQLHMGHALNCTIQDILVSFKRFQGYNALLLPGKDHAAIATEVKVAERLLAQGISKSDIGREKFIEKTNEWYDEFGSKIGLQFRKMGIAADWDREKFTMEPDLCEAVLEAFVRLHKKGYIYKGERLVNWCVQCKTSISDAEVEHKESAAGFWHFKYPVKDSDEFVVFATTRPETMLGDVAIAVNPDDERYSHLIGKTAIMPIFGRELPIVADSYVKADFGTGMVKITPAHDFNDFEIGLRHNLPLINIMNDDGTINENGGPYEGLARYDARKRIVAEFTELGLFVKKEDITNSVGEHDRCHNVVEPLVKMQWFVKMSELAKPALEAYKTGELNIHPERFGKIYSNWLENIRDWCISRQLWTGHRIPAYYCQNCDNIVVAKEAPSVCTCGCESFVQDEDVLDTWFSSALWPFATLGWPKNTADLEYFYPGDVLVTAYEIIFFWVIRMVFSGYEFMGQKPFADVLINGIVRDELGRKLSKALGNGEDPLEIIEKFGADALRISMIAGVATGGDSRFLVEKTEAARNFLNKVWNASRFIMMNEDEFIDTDNVLLQPEDEWILAKINKLAKDYENNLNHYELALAYNALYSFIWDEFCDWYIEMVKPRLYNKDDKTRSAALHTLGYVLCGSLVMLHPFAPFITEEIYTNITGGRSILLCEFEEYHPSRDFEDSHSSIEVVKEAIRAIRNVRAEMNVAPSKKAKLIFVSQSEENRQFFGNCEKFIKSLAGISELIVQDNSENIDNNAVSIVSKIGQIFIPFNELVDIQKEKERLNKEYSKMLSEIERIDNKLNNQGFVAKAPAKIIDEEKQKREKFIDMLKLLESKIEELNVL